MKLVIRQYLASLKERGELDVLLPDLLSQMGLEVILRPGIGARQFGVDVAAVGKLNDGEEKVYLFSVKSGDLGRRDWDGGNPQDLRPSINEIIDSFIPTRIPPEHQAKPIEICLCFGGEIKEEVRPNVSGFLQRETTEKLSFSEWNGDHLAALIERYFLREELLPETCRGLLRKSLAMVDEPDISFKHFSALVALLGKIDKPTPKKSLMAIRQLNICTWILFAWCREADNIESAYLGSERALLNGWDFYKEIVGKKDKSSLAIAHTFHSLMSLHLTISNYYLEQKIIPHQGLYALSTAISPACAVDVNLKLFDVVGRVAMMGMWLHRHLLSLDEHEVENWEVCSTAFRTYQEALKKIIYHNPMLLSPYKDEQAIDIVLAIWFLALSSHHVEDLDYWLRNMVESTYIRFRQNQFYPSTIRSYAELIEHPLDDSEEYRKSITKGSILYPYLSAFAAIFNFDETYRSIQQLKTEFLSHCNCQVYFLDETAEEHLYCDSANHGAVLSNASLDKAPTEYMAELLEECQQSAHFNELSAVKCGYWPLVMMACRHYRLPIPMHFLINMYEAMKPKQAELTAE